MEEDIRRVLMRRSGLGLIAAGLVMLVAVGGIEGAPGFDGRESSTRASGSTGAGTAARAEASLDVREAPRIEFAEDYFSFGRIGQEERRTHVFKFVNLGRRTLTIKGLKST